MCMRNYRAIRAVTDIIFLTKCLSSCGVGAFVRSTLMLLVCPGFDTLAEFNHKHYIQYVPQNLSGLICGKLFKTFIAAAGPVECRAPLSSRHCSLVLEATFRVCMRLCVRVHVCVHVCNLSHYSQLQYSCTFQNSYFCFLIIA